MPISTSPSPATNSPFARGALKRHNKHCSPEQMSARAAAPDTSTGLPIVCG
jgi:hypothetical protein